MPRVLGVDGCPGGWIGVSFECGTPGDASFAFFSSFQDLLATDATVIAVDMPIGLPGSLIGRGRACEIEARKRLGARQSSVFAIPSRKAVMTTDYREACQVALATSDPPRKVSKQAYFLFPKIREIDALWRPGLESRVFECHPELAFWSLNGGVAMDLPKKVRSRVNPDGIAQRRERLVASGFERDFLTPQVKLPGSAKIDDLIDATVCAWSASRIEAGVALSFPDPPEIDDLGRPMAITV